MTKAEKIDLIIRTLDQLYPQVRPTLDSIDAYTHLVAVLLSAQCTDVRVNLVTPKLFALAATPEDMVGLSVEQIQSIIRPCGLSANKSKAIAGLSQILLDKHAGQVPDNLADLEALPGVGHKTAQVVLSQCFGQPMFAVDTHVHRLAYRWGLSNGKNVVQTEKDLKRLFPKDRWNDLHIQIILFGRQYCPARQHHFADCPLCSRVGRKSMGQ